MGLQRILNQAERETKRDAGGVSRRTFLLTGAAAGGGLLVGFALPRFIDVKAATASGDNFAPNAFIRIGADNSVTLIMPQVEMGQGTYTSMSMLIAEELEVELAQVTAEAAPPSDKLYANPLLGFQVTGGSTSVPAFWEPLRHAGAVARVMLINAAANDWGVDPASCHAEKGEVINPATGAEAEIWRAGRCGGEAADAGQGRAQGPQGLHADRNAGQAHRHAGESERQSRLRHRCDDSRHEVRHRGGVPGFWRQARQGRRQQDDDGSGRTPGGASRQCRGGGWRQYVGRDARPRRARHRLG